MRDINNIIDTTSYLIDSLSDDEQVALESTIDAFDSALSIYSAALENNVELDSVEDAFDKLDSEIEKLEAVEEPDYAKMRRKRIIKNTINVIKGFLITNGIVLTHQIYSREGSLSKDSVVSYMKTASEMRKVAREHGIVKIPKNLTDVTVTRNVINPNNDNYIVNPLNRKKGTADMSQSLDKLTAIRNAQRQRKSNNGGVVNTSGDAVRVSKSVVPTIFGNMYRGGNIRIASEGYDIDDDDAYFYQIANEATDMLDEALTTYDHEAIKVDERLDELETMINETLQIPDEIKRAKRERMITNIFKKLLRLFAVIGLVSAATVTAHEGKFDMESIKNFIATYKSKKALRKSAKIKRGTTVKDGKYSRGYQTDVDSAELADTISMFLTGTGDNKTLNRMNEWDNNASRYLDISHEQKERRNANLMGSIEKLRKLSAVSKNKTLDAGLSAAHSNLSQVNTSQYHGVRLKGTSAGVGFNRTRSSTVQSKINYKKGVDILG